MSHNTTSRVQGLAGVLAAALALTTIGAGTADRRGSNAPRILEAAIGQSAIGQSAGSRMKVDGDRVDVVREAGVAGKVRIRLKSDGTWWKMLRLQDAKGAWHKVEQADRRYVDNADTFEVEVSRLGATFALELWKAKEFGIHRYITSRRYNTNAESGKLLTYFWREGWRDDDPVPAAGVRSPIRERLTVEGNRVTIESADDGTPGRARVRFGTTMNWWTAIYLLDRQGRKHGLSKQDGVYSPAGQWLNLPLTQFPPEIVIEFWTAKTLGVHTYMTRVKFAKERFDGRTVTVSWLDFDSDRPFDGGPINERVKVDQNDVTLRSAEGGRAGHATVKFNTSKEWWTAIYVVDRDGRKHGIE